jgi:hypothetical protein
MVKPTAKILISILVLFIIVFCIDYLFFRQLFWQRLIVNIAIFIVYIIIFTKYLNKE